MNLRAVSDEVRKNMVVFDETKFVHAGRLVICRTSSTGRMSLGDENVAGYTLVVVCTLVKDVPR